MSLDLTGSMVTPLSPSLSKFVRWSAKSSVSNVHQYIFVRYLRRSWMEFCVYATFHLFLTILFRLSSSAILSLLRFEICVSTCRLQTVCLPPPASQCPAITASFVWVIPVCNNWHQVSLGSSVKYSADTDVTDVDSDARKGQLICEAFDLTTVPM